MSKQTAVEWLIEQFKIISDNLPENGLFDNAKNMEREQIEDAYGDGLNGHRTNFCNRSDYYTQTYGNKFLDLVSPETSQVHEVVKKLKEENNNEQN